jgi:DNA (cytosine-5)-methyltransferase 1
MYRLLDLFSGIGGFSLGLERSGGFKTVAFCEIEPFPRRVLRKHWPDVPIYEDVRTLTAERLAADGISVDAICGGFPCQDASIANISGEGAAGKRTGLYAEAIRLAGEIGCPIIMENVTELLNRGFGDVLAALAEGGFDAEWHCIPANAVGAPHERDRLWIFAYPGSQGREGLKQDIRILERAAAALPVYGNSAFDPWRALVRDINVLRGGDGLSVGMERRRLHGCGNAVVPQIPELIGRAIMEAEVA